MAIQITSLLAYQEALKSLGEKQVKVYNKIKSLGRPVNNRMLSELMDWPINRVTPRVLELRELGLVEEAYTAQDTETKRQSIYWRAVTAIKEVAKQLTLL